MASPALLLLLLLVPGTLHLGAMHESGVQPWLGLEIMSHPPPPTRGASHRTVRFGTHAEAMYGVP